MTAADRPTGPATAEDRLLDWLRDVRYFQARELTAVRNRLRAVKAAERARILAVLPEALMESGMSEWSDSIEGESVVFGGTVAELAAALAAAIEKVLG